MLLINDYGSMKAIIRQKAYELLTDMLGHGDVLAAYLRGDRGGDWEGNQQSYDNNNFRSCTRGSVPCPFRTNKRMCPSGSNT